MNDRMLDIHCHLVYDVDDGAQNAQDMYDLLEDEANNGVIAAIATSHITPGIQEFPEEKYLSHLDEANRYCTEHGLLLHVYSGAEILYSPYTETFLANNRIHPLADTQYVLVEFLPDITFREMAKAAEEISHCGYFPIFAHIERYECLTRHITNVYDIKNLNLAKLQINCGSVLAPDDRSQKRFVYSLLQDRLIDFVASDTHSRAHRPCKMSQAYSALVKLVGESYANHLVSGEELRY